MLYFLDRPVVVFPCIMIRMVKTTKVAMTLMAWEVIPEHV